MNIVISSVIAAARGQSIRTTLTNLAKDHADRFNAGGTNGPLSPKQAAKVADEALINGSDDPLGSPTDAVRQHLRLDCATLSQENRTDELVAMVTGARKLRDWLDEFESVAGRAARAEGATVRQLANATGISERHAANRFKLIPGEGLTSRM